MQKGKCKNDELILCKLKTNIKRDRKKVVRRLFYVGSHITRI